MKLAFALLPFALILGCGATSDQVNSAPPKAGFTDIVLSEDKTGTTPVTSFNKDAPILYVTFGLSGVAAGDKIKGTWVCEEAKDIPANLVIDSATVTITEGMNAGDFSLSKPIKGWPVGSYRVDMYWNEKLMESVKFKIKA